MTELEIIRHAKDYLDKLADGVNPLDGTAVPADDVAAQEKLVRCFRFVSDVLGRVVERGGLEPRPVFRPEPITVCNQDGGFGEQTTYYRKPAKVKFTIPLERLSGYEYAEEPVVISEICRRVNRLYERNDMKKLRYADVAGWLCKVGMIEQETLTDGTLVREVTPQGAEKGLSVEERIGFKGPYRVILCSPEAQHIIVEHMGEIVENIQ